MPRGWHELLHDDDAIGPILTLANRSPSVEVLDATEAAGAAALEWLQVTTGSPLGAIAFHTGGILVDGWLRILGAGHPRLDRSLQAWNRGPRLEGGVLVADDAIGGFFAWRRESMAYFSPETFEWELLDMGYHGWLDAMLTGAITPFYDGLRWPGWQSEVATLAANEVLQIYPPLPFDGPPIAERSRKPVPIEQLWTFQTDVAEKLADGATSLAVEVTE